MDNEDIKASNLASYSDGSVENDLPMQQLSELFNVNHFIVSQVIYFFDNYQSWSWRSVCLYSACSLRALTA